MASASNGGNAMDTSADSTLASAFILVGQRENWEKYRFANDNKYFYRDVDCPSSPSTWVEPRVWSAPYDEQNQQFGRTILEERKGRHSPWALGGFAELLHNSKDARATVVSWAIIQSALF